MTGWSLPRGTPSKLLATLHRRFLDTDRPKVPWARLDPTVLDDAEREVVRRAWAARVDAEYRSMVVFGELIARLPEAGVSLEASCAASRLLQDEARHTELCARMADALGGHPEARFDAASLRLVDGLPAHLFVARWTASMLCVGETASVGLLQVLAARTTDPCARVVVEILLRDEILHDRFGWALAAEVLPRLGEDEREWLAADLAFTFAHYDRIDAACMRPDGAALPAEPDDARDRWQAKNLGVSSRESFARAFYTRLDGVILPGLHALGIPAYEAWAARGDTVR
ncbi:MAG: ferritin-like domain-containing protein [Polyangiales bacterium]